MATVLVVDDDDGVRAIAGIAIKLTGNEVRDASDGLEALAVLAQRPIDLMVLDLEMPRMDGWATYWEARRGGYAGPVLILSAHGAKRAARELGADSYISKPFDPDDLQSEALQLISTINRQRVGGDVDQS